MKGCFVTRSIVLLASAGLAACYGVGQGTWTPDGGAGNAPVGTGASGSGGASGSSGSGAGTTPGTPTGLPCDIQAILQAHCTGCHSDPPVSGPMGLVTFADLTAPAVTDPTKTVAALSLVRIQSATAPMPMPPAAPLSASDIGTFQSWVSAGTPMGSCAPADGGGAGAGGGNPYGTPLTCTSGSYWSGGGDNTGPGMAPGGACIACHAQNGDGAPRFAIAGTVYPTAHEPLDCNGASGVSVVITDATGRTMSFASNGAGNFFGNAALSMPFTAKVVANGRERAMSTPQTNGDCNACHGEPSKNGAPGRVMAP